ncbi:hypothetical protein CBR_g49408 [Chara braunii]|uniref:Pentacotripeptide-repeat region of PRORP domain-containing protein n=1 Tax=Chara braunii TaxID=69332 RepID=A0A388M4V7_CHABU|nr:hypothetical protein CBR_g49408 [Chara braunii]|eukprot:GBG89618.1 hypothetical protein CBR_g49408 [Chara braunii]
MTANVVHYTTLIDACLRCKWIKRAFDIFSQMRTENIQPNQITFTLMLEACGFLGDLEQAMEMADMMRCSGIEMDRISFQTLMSLCATHADVDAAQHVLDWMTESNLPPDEDIHTSMILTYCNADRVDEALQILRNAVVEKHFRLSTEAYAHLINRFGKLKQPGRAMEVFRMIQENGLSPTTQIYKATISSFHDAKFSELEPAMDLFEEGISRGLLNNFDLSRLEWGEEKALTVNLVNEGPGVSVTALLALLRMLKRKNLRPEQVNLMTTSDKLLTDQEWIVPAITTSLLEEQLKLPYVFAREFGVLTIQGKALDRCLSKRCILPTSSIIMQTDSDRDSDWTASSSLARVKHIWAGEWETLQQARMEEVRKEKGTTAKELENISNWAEMTKGMSREEKRTFFVEMFRERRILAMREKRIKERYGKVVRLKKRVGDFGYIYGSDPNEAHNTGEGRVVVKLYREPSDDTPSSREGALSGELEEEEELPISPHGKHLTPTRTNSQQPPEGLDLNPRAGFRRTEREESRVQADDKVEDGACHESRVENEVEERADKAAGEDLPEFDGRPITRTHATPMSGEVSRQERLMKEGAATAVDSAEGGFLPLARAEIGHTLSGHEDASGHADPSGQGKSVIDENQKTANSQQSAASTHEHPLEDSEHGVVEAEGTPNEQQRSVAVGEVLVAQDQEEDGERESGSEERKVGGEGERGGAVIQCQAVTKSGAKCKRRLTEEEVKAQGGVVKCWQHR